MQYFIPSDSPPRLRVLSTAFNAVPPAVARAAIEQHTQPGEVILDPFASGLGVIQAAVELGRKVIAARSIRSMRWRCVPRCGPPTPDRLSRTSKMRSKRRIA